MVTFAPDSPRTPPVLPVLTRLGVALARHRAYTAGHPMVRAATEALADALLGHIADGTPLQLAVANRDLLVNGTLMPRSLGIVRDLAMRLHLAGIGVLRFQSGLTVHSLDVMLDAVSRRASDGAVDHELPEVPGVVLGRLDYEQLGFADPDALRAEGEAIWRQLADRALQRAGITNGRHAEAGETDPDALARALVGAGGDGVTEPARLMTALAAIADKAVVAPRPVRELLGARLEQLLGAVDDRTLTAMLQQGADHEERLHLINVMVDVLPATAVVRWLQVASTATGHDMSQHLVRLLAKMASHQSLGAHELGDEQVREAATELLQGWEAAEPNPSEHAALLDALASLQVPHPSTIDGGARLHSIVHEEASRLVQMACELDFVSDDARMAARHLAEHAVTADVLQWIADAPSDATRRELLTLALTPEAIRRTLLADPFPQEDARQLLAAVPDDASATLLDALERAEHRTARRMIYDRLRSAGPAIDPLLRARLAQPAPWYFVRNLLALLREVHHGSSEPLSPHGTLVLFQSHEHWQVRREAVRLLMLHPQARWSTLRRAIDDAMPDVLQAALDALLSLPHGELPRELALKLLQVAGGDTRDSIIREKAVRAVLGARHPEVKAWLLAHVTRRAGLFGGVRLANPSDTVRAALQVLALDYGTEADVAPVLAAARSQQRIPTMA